MTGAARNEPWTDGVVSSGTFTGGIRWRSTGFLAQQVISEPGYCAFFYPNANCQNKGPANPYTDPNYPRYGNQSYANQGYLVPDNSQTVGVARRPVRRSTTRMQ